MTTLENIDYYQDGEDVTPEVLNRPLANLENNQNAINTDVVAIGDGVLPEGFVGSWVGAAGGYPAGAKFSYQGSIWELVNNIAEVSSVAPSLTASSVWFQYNNTSGATGGGNDKLFLELDKVMTTSHSISEGKNVITASYITEDPAELEIPDSSDLYVLDFGL